MRDPRPLFVLGLTLLLASPVAALDIYQCGTTVPPNEVGELRADLACMPPDGASYAGIVLESGASLQMNGHTIVTSAIGSGVHCMPGRCTITGPGVVTGAGTGITGAKARMDVTGVTLTDNHGMIDNALGKLSLTDVTATQTSGLGIRAAKITVQNVSVDMGDAGNCVMGQRGVRGSDLTVSHCHEGVTSLLGSVVLDRLTSVGNSIGVSAGGTIVLTDSTVTGSYFPPTQGLDLLSRRKPRLTSTSCDKSARWDHLPGGSLAIGAPWGVCSLD